jgi:hypothetical protein
MLSRYCLVAVTRLIQQAMQQEAVSAEQARKACAALLKLDLTRFGIGEIGDAGVGAGGSGTPGRTLRRRSARISCGKCSMAKQVTINRQALALFTTPGHEMLNIERL